jgi:hypothetical protein
MQLSGRGESTPSVAPLAPLAPSLSGRLRAAACMLLAAAGTPAAATAQTPGQASTSYELTGLYYAEAQRTSVIEPVGRITRLFADGQSLSAQFALDVMSGASPTGANPSGVSQTVTSASGTTTTVPADQVPTAMFKDTRGALDLEWVRPLGVLTPTLGAHYSREKDYQSFGANAKLSLDVNQRLTTFTVGGGTNRDSVFPLGGIVPGLSPVTTTVGGTGGEGGEGGGGSGTSSASKQVGTGLVGISQVLTRRWLVGADLSRTWEQGYLTEPYKVVSLLDGTTGFTTGQLTEKRPDSRLRTSVLVNSVYHLSQDIAYVSYRYYWDDWNIRSHTIDVRYRRDMESGAWLEPHARYYTQSAADFFHQGLVQGQPLPAFASADQRLGELRTVTLGATYGFKLPGQQGDMSVRAEYMGQFGNGHPADAVGVQRQYDLAPPVNIFSLVLGWSFGR